MPPGVRGRLISATFAQTHLQNLPGTSSPPPDILRSLDLWSHRRDTSIGPASSVRGITELVAIPLLRMAGLDIRRRVDRDGLTVIVADAGRHVPLATVVVGWGESLDRVWRTTVVDSIGVDARWCFCCNGISLRIVDAHHAWSRHYLEFDLALLAHEPGSQRLFWSLARAEAWRETPSVLDRAVEMSARLGVAVCKALGSGVVEALGCLLASIPPRQRSRSAATRDLFEQTLTVLYRVLFLLFAEARGLVPLWHPVYRERYTIDSLVTTLLSGKRCRGVWQAVQAISRLAHSGCSAGELKVTAFNGRLFAPGRAAAFEGALADDQVMGRAVLAVSTVRQGGNVARISYRDLGVEQLGAVYEHVLDFEPAHNGSRALTRTRDVRKSGGTFYTPRSMTAHLVRQTLAPLVAGRSSDEILGLRVLDPAMGSGAFLVEACRYLGRAVEAARIHEGRWHPGDVTAAERAAVGREVAQRCLFGVDLNPMAVQLARLSLWLATLASDKPLSFLDHHLVTGDSLIGASLEDIRRQPSRGAASSRRPLPLPLFEAHDLQTMMAHVVRTRLRLSAEPDDSPAVVERKERALEELGSPDAPVQAWRRALDLWCAGWFWDEGPPPNAKIFNEVCGHLLQGSSVLGRSVLADILERSASIAGKMRFLHWSLAFPEVFLDEEGAPGVTPGFDAVVGNPPWDMVRGDSGDEGVRTERRGEARRLTDFVRTAGIYRVEGRSHVNRYQLFVERALQLIRPGGRVGLVLPSGAVSDTGTAALRRHLFDRAEVDSVIGFDNRGRIFPIHRSVKFVLLTATTGRPTVRLACRFGETRAEALDDASMGRPPLMLTRALLHRVSGEDDLGIPELTTPLDLRIVERISARVPWLGSAAGWNVQFGRELNASDDRAAFVEVQQANSGSRAPNPGFPVPNPESRIPSPESRIPSPVLRPLLEGKHIEPFRARIARCTLAVPADDPASARVPRRPRLAYRDVASATNRLTLIAAIVPARVVTTHTLLCLKTSLGLDAQHVLCALMNSFVANYFVRLRVNTHVTASLVARLPVPLVRAEDPDFTTLARLARRLAANVTPGLSDEYPVVQAHVARLYGLDEAAFAHVLATFPLIGEEVKAKSLGIFRQF